MSKVKKVWNDPVGSNVIAEGIKELIKYCWGLLIVPIYALIKAIFSKMSFIDSIKQTWTAIVNFLFKGFQINYLTIIFLLIGYFLLTKLFKNVVTFFSSRSIKSFNHAVIWGANIRWKWERNAGEWQVKYGNYELSCPHCLHNLKHDQVNGRYYLKCQNLNCDFNSAIYHYEPPSNVIILADMSTYYFHTALTSMLDAELRKKGIKK